MTTARVSCNRITCASCVNSIPIWINTMIWLWIGSNSSTNFAWTCVSWRSFTSLRCTCLRLTRRWQSIEFSCESNRKSISERKKSKQQRSISPGHNSWITSMIWNLLRKKLRKPQRKRLSISKCIRRSRTSEIDIIILIIQWIYSSSSFLSPPVLFGWSSYFYRFSFFKKCILLFCHVFNNYFLV